MSDAHPESISELLRLGMRQWATGVTIVTTHSGGEWHGMTVSSFTSISLSPPLILVSLQNETRTQALVKQSGVFGVTILDETQAGVSDRFAGRPIEVPDRFAGLETFVLTTGSPMLQIGLANFDCHVAATYSVVEHTLFIGEVVAVRLGQEKLPLIYYNRNYRYLRSV